MVPLTVSLFIGNDDSRRRGIFKALVYGLSIIGIYYRGGGRSGPAAGRAGPQLPGHALAAEPGVFVAFGLSFLGLFEIALPNGLVNKVDKQADKGG